MALVLGIDAAWTARGSSGIALLRVDPTGNAIIGAAPSYNEFISFAGIAGADSAMPSAAALLRAAEALGGGQVGVVAIDMPMSRLEIVSRRPADDAVSRAFGAAWAGTHSPTPGRPGTFGRQLMQQFENAGYPLKCAGENYTDRALIEVYPLASLVRLLNVERRPCYKVDRRKRYWPTLTDQERRHTLIAQWELIVDALARNIACRPVPRFGPKTTRRELKAYEDTLDAQICAWIGLCFTQGRTECFGGKDAAIWIPLPSERSAAPVRDR